MQKEIYSLDHIKHTQFETWTEFYESLENDEAEKPSAVVRYRSKEGELKEIELPFRKEDIQFLAYYEALDEIKSMGLSSFHELGQQMDKKIKTGQKDYQHYYVTRGENGTIEMHSVLVPIERIARFASVEKQELMKFADLQMLAHAHFIDKIMKAKIHTLPGLTAKEIIDLASQAEKNDDGERAIELYENAIRKKALVEIPHRRLMVIYRKNKNFKEELKVIDRAIKLWSDYFKSLQDDMHANHPARAKIKRLSLSIEKKLAAKHIEPEPIAEWLKRKQLIQKKMGKNNKHNR